MKTRLPRLSSHLRRIFIIYFSAFLLVIAPASTAFAQQDTSGTIQQSSSNSNPTDKDNPELVTGSKPEVAVENGTQISCNGVVNAFTFGGCGALQDAAHAISDLPGTIMGFLKDKIFDLLQLILSGALVLVGKIFNFNACSAIPGFSANFGFCSSSSMNTPDNFTLFTVMDIGISGVYQSFPYHGPINYFADEFQNNLFGIGSAHAQGVGTSSLEAVRSFWQKILDFSLVIMVLVIIAISFMIMFRRKLPDRSIVSVLNALPRLAISLVLMVFSFAIGGLFIDFVYLSVNIMRNYFSDLGGFEYASQKLGGELIMLPVFTLFSTASLIDYSKLFALNSVAAYTGSIIGFIVFIIIEILIRLALFGAAIWLFWKLVTSFATMIGLIIFSPLIFMVGAVPGFEGAIWDWFKRMAAHALVFPSVIVVLNIGLGLWYLSSPWMHNIHGHLQAPPPIGSSIVSIPYLLGIGFIFFATKLPSFYEQAFGIKPGARGGVSPGAMIFAPVTTTMSAFSRRPGSLGSSFEPAQRLTARLGQIPFIGAPFRGISSIAGGLNKFTGGAPQGGPGESPGKRAPSGNLSKEDNAAVSGWKTTGGVSIPKDYEEGTAGTTAGPGPTPTQGGGASNIPNTQGKETSGGPIAPAPGTGGDKTADSLDKAAGAAERFTGAVDKASDSVSGRTINPDNDPKSKT